MYRSLKKNRPTTLGALAEVLLVLAVGIVVVGMYRGWFTTSADNRIRPTTDDKVRPTVPIAAAKDAFEEAQ